MTCNEKGQVSIKITVCDHRIKDWLMMYTHKGPIKVTQATLIRAFYNSSASLYNLSVFS